MVVDSFVADAQRSFREVPLVPRNADEFQLALKARTRRVWVTSVIVLINAAVFVAMVVKGVDPWLPDAADVIKWGANYSPLTTGGQWWRLLTCSFVHFGAVHVSMNMVVLWHLGSLVERLVGRWRLLAVYAIAALWAAVASIAWNPFLVAAGASGAIFGVFGLLAVVAFRNRGALPPDASKKLRRTIVTLVLLNLALGLLVGSIDLAAHVGGLVLGLCAGLVVSRPIATTRPAREAIALLAGLALALGAFGALPRSFDLRREMTEFRAMHDSTAAIFNAAVFQRQRGDLTDAELANIIEQRVRPPWREHLDRLRSVLGLPRGQHARVGRLVEYASLREESWSKLTEALRTSDASKDSEADALIGQASAMRKSITELDESNRGQ